MQGRRNSLSNQKRKENQGEIDKDIKIKEKKTWVRFQRCIELMIPVELVGRFTDEAKGAEV